jgi:hypothetical protein
MLHYLWMISVLFGCECRLDNVETAWNTKLLANLALEMEHQNQRGENAGDHVHQEMESA